MNKRKTIYCLTKEQLKNPGCFDSFWNKYKVVGVKNDVKLFFTMPQNSIDYLIIYNPQKFIHKLDKCLIEYLKHVFKRIVVVSSLKIHILKDYTFVPYDLVKDNLKNIISVANCCEQSFNYAYSHYHKVCTAILTELGFNIKHKAFEYIVKGSYLSILFNGKVNIYSDIYSKLATEHNTTVEAVERAIRNAINKAKTVNKEAYNGLLQLSNKKFLINLNKHLVKLL